MIAPVAIERAHEHDLCVRWPDGHDSVYPARALRLACPCAGCVDELTGRRRLTEASVAQEVVPVRIHLVGRYAISIDWSDGHRTGIYSFELLRRICPCGGHEA